MEQHITPTSIRERVRSHPAYSPAKLLCITLAADAARGKDPEAMRLLGGWTAIVNRAIDQAAHEEPILNFDLGSKMFPRTMADELHVELPDIRDDAKDILNHEARQ